MPEMPDERDPRGWGHIARRATPAERDGVSAMLAARFGADAVWIAPQAIQPVRRPPRPRIPAALSHLMSADPDVRLLHAVGRSFSDLVALRETGVDLLPIWSPCRPTRQGSGRCWSGVPMTVWRASRSAAARRSSVG